MLAGLNVEHLGACRCVRLVTYRHTVACFPLKLAPTATNIQAHMEPLYIALRSKQASERAHACSDTLHARRGRRIKLLGWLELRPWGRLRHRWPWRAKGGGPRPCSTCLRHSPALASRVVPRVPGYRVWLHHTETRLTHKRPYPLCTPRVRIRTVRAPPRDPRAPRHVGRPPASAPAGVTTQNDMIKDTAHTYTKHATLPQEGVARR